jgi:hypothetical protein
MLMKISAKTWFIFLSFTALMACRSTQVQGNQTESKQKAEFQFKGVWIKSQEENSGDGVYVYRRPNYPFPPSRGRERYEFEGEKVTYYKIAPTDGLDQIFGKWTFSSQKDELYLTFDNGLKMVFRILSQTEDRMLLKLAP